MVATSTDPGQLWAAVLGQLQMQVTKPNFDTWLKHTSGLAYADGEFVVGTPNAFVAEMLEQRMYSLIAQTVESVVEAEVEVRFAVESAWAEPSESMPTRDAEQRSPSPQPSPSRERGRWKGCPLSQRETGEKVG